MEVGESTDLWRSHAHFCSSFWWKWARNVSNVSELSGALPLCLTASLSEIWLPIPWSRCSVVQSGVSSEFGGLTLPCCCQPGPGCWLLVSFELGPFSCHSRVRQCGTSGRRQTDCPSSGVFLDRFPLPSLDICLCAESRKTRKLRTMCYITELGFWEKRAGSPGVLCLLGLLQPGWLLNLSLMFVW